MDRRHRAFLTLLWAGSWLGSLIVAHGQQPGATPAATPWVQASPPPPAPNLPLAPKPAPPNALRQEMERRRQQELASGANAAPEPDLARAMQGMTPDERRAFERNLATWQTLSPAEKQALRGQAVDRIRAEIEKAYRDSGLALTPDQREVFALRYRQERRRLERELQERVNAERARRIAEIVERLKKEFPPAGSPAPGGTL